MEREDEPLNEPINKSLNSDDFRTINYNDDDLDAKCVDNEGNKVEKVFGFNQNAELVNSRAAMFGFLMLILTELVFKVEAATKSIFGIGL